MISRRQLLASSLALPVTGQRPDRPNIILVMTDDQGYGDVARHGNPVLETPHLDRLHGESVRFTDFQVSATCAPTRAALLSGKHEFRSGVSHTILERERLSLQTATVAQALQRSGYDTGIFGKWHLGDADAYLPDKRGFGEVFIHGCGGIGQKYPGTCADAPGNSYFDPVIWHNGRFERTSGYCTDVFFGQALRWIGERRETRQPFFAYITPNAPHAPLDCPEEYIARYRGRVPNENTARFFGMVANIDDNMGRLLSRLREWQLERNTLLIFLTDNGGTGGVSIFNDGMRGAKNTPFRGGVRVPSFWRWTGTLIPGERPQLAAHIDVAPTLAEVARARLRQPAEGRSLWPLLRNSSAPWPDRLLFSHLGRWPAGEAARAKYAGCRVRNQRFSLVNQNRGPEGWELFDLSADPGEQNNVAAAHPAEVQAMAAAYDRWWQSVLPQLVNESAVPPAEPPYWTRYRAQFGALPEGVR